MMAPACCWADWRRLAVTRAIMLFVLVQVVRELELPEGWPAGDDNHLGLLVNETVQVGRGLLDFGRRALRLGEGGRGGRAGSTRLLSQHSTGDWVTR